eukprot:TRINITY_DN8352_c0_g7_i1.p1 TRINITY_DN8352_c0_g7~~TRINITY_DN8352_c0_g7_i1.p1  ORF type:complete len:340 (-),score=52.86 TRINITY_DN8352_c0_g7_i1:262-1281(-)
MSDASVTRLYLSWAMHLTELFTNVWLLATSWAIPLVVGSVIGFCLGAVVSRCRHSKATLQGTAEKKQSKKKTPTRRFAKRGGDGDRSWQNASDKYSREVFCEDAIAWLDRLPDGGLPDGCAVITGIPDIQEMDPDGRLGLAWWKSWALKAIESIFRKLPEGGYAILMQTDVKVSESNAHRRGSCNGGYWEYVDKAHLVQLAADRVPGVRLLWHRIIVAGSSEKFGWHSAIAGYSHCLCFVKGGKPEPFSGPPFPEVCRKGLMTWVSGFGIQAVEQACAYAVERGCSVVIDPFCGEGATLAVGNALGMSAIGIEICAKRARQAEKLDGERLLADDRAERI